MNIPRSPYTFVMEEESMKLTVSTKPFVAGSVEWPVYEVDGKYYLQEKFIFNVPKGANVIKVNLASYRGIQVSKCTIMDTFSGVCWADFASNTALTYPRIGVSQNHAYELKVNDMSPIDYTHGSLKFEWSYEINKDTVTVEDYVDE